MFDQGSSTPSEVEISALTNDEPWIQEFSKRGAYSLFFPSWKVEDMRGNKDEERSLVHTQMTTAPDIASLVDPGSPEDYVETMRCQPTAS